MQKKTKGLILSLLLGLLVFQSFNFKHNERTILVHGEENTIYVASNGNNSNDGSITAPKKTIAGAVSAAPDGGNVYLLSDLSGQTEFLIDKSLTIASSPISAAGDPITTNFKLLVRTPATTTGSDPRNNHFIRINGGNDVVFRNITINGQRSNQNAWTNSAHPYSNIVLGNNHATLPATLTLEKTIVRQAHRSNGPSAIQLNHGILIVKDGSNFTANYQNASQPIIFAAASNSNSGTKTNQVIFLGGEISSNTVNGNGSVINSNTYIDHTVLGGTFRMFNNNYYSSGNFAGYRKFVKHSDQKVITGFGGYVDFSTNGTKGNTISGFTVVDENLDPISEDFDPYFLGIMPSNNDFLHPVYNPDNNNYYWDYVYGEYEITTYPTKNSTGLAVRKAMAHDQNLNIIYSDTYTDSLVLPKLDDDNYTATFNNSTETMNYEITIDGEFFSLNYIVDEANYSYEVIEDPTLDETGTIIKVHSDFPGFVFDEVTLPKLNGEDYDYTLTSNNITYTYTDEYDVTHDFDVVLPINGYETDAILVTDLDVSITVNFTHPSLEGVVIPITLPAFNDVDYIFVSQDGNEATYTYYDSTLDITVEIVIPILIDGFVEDNTAYVEMPTATEGSNVVIDHEDLHGVKLEIALPELNGNDYDVTYDDDHVIYTYIDPNTGVPVTLTFDLPLNGYNNPVVTLDPTITLEGKAIITHPDYPGLEIEIELPKLNDEDYDVILNSDGTYSYVLKDNRFGQIELIVPMDREVNLWPVIIIEIVLIVALIALGIYLFLKKYQKEDKTKLAMSVLPLLLLVDYRPDKAILIIILLAVLIILLGGFVSFLFYIETKAKKVKEVAHEVAKKEKSEVKKEPPKAKKVKK